MTTIQYILSYFQALYSLTSEMAPYLLLGFLIAGILHVYMPKHLFSKWFGQKNFKSVLYASLMGIPLPLCSCGVIPTGISMHKDGASKGSTVSFLISTPQTGVDSIMVTYSLLGLPFAIIRPIIALITGIFGGMAVNAIEKDEHLEEVNTVEATIETPQKKSIQSVIKYSFGEFLGDIADWLIIGLALAGLISILIPEHFFESSVFSNEIGGMFIILVASIPFYVCATGSVPIAAALLLKGLNPGAVLVFLMAGPATNVATMTVIAQTLGKRVLITYMSAIIVGAMAFGMMINAFLPPEFFKPVLGQALHHQGQLLFWIELVSTILLLLMLFRHYVVKVMNMITKSKGKNMKSEESVVFKVDGMSCQNCRQKVESTLLKLGSVNESNADLETHEVRVKGSNIDLDKIKVAIEEIGYVFKQS